MIRFSLYPKAFVALIVTLGLFVLPVNAIAQAINQVTQALAFRSIGPALMGGRIADIAIHPENPSTWYVAAGSGNLWKTTNRGTTWDPIFDEEASYSIGTVVVDPLNPNVVWVGTGENVSGRHVGWGDGVYKSLDAGKTWKNMGLSASEHIGKILIDPRDSDVILVAAEGPLWSGGGERGVYRSMDGGKSWKATLTVDQYTGVTDIEFDPSNPSVVYAATYQRFRRTWAFMAGGPNSGIYKSTDNGKSWRKLTVGLPSRDMGKIGIATTAADPNLVYATIEAGKDEKGFYRSTDKGESWEKRNDYISGGTGPHYYQEIEASPEDPDLVYQMDVFLHVTNDGGATFQYLTNGQTKHSDNHALWINPSDGQHLIVGTDGGLYESFDHGATWQHFSNLPISQFYKIGVDNTVPFYNIVGGAQDLGTLIGPGRVTNVEGIRNRDWYVPLGADGYGSVYDWKDDKTAYMMWQEGSLVRLDVSTGETIGIRPQPIDTEVPERWNWDSPILVSSHNHKRLYFGSQRLWKSENRGDSWEAVSGDLTTNTNRYELSLMDRVWSVDDLYDNGAMSKYATLTTIAESPLVEGLLYTGSDDGLIKVSEDGGGVWKNAALKIPSRSFINDVHASSTNPDQAFAAVDAHKLGDYAPYLFMTKDRGKSWRSISGDLPMGAIVWSVVQDFENENLLFLGTEKGVYYSINTGQNWNKLSSGMPTISVRDLVLHPRDGDLIASTFGRGIYVLDDYTPLRKLSDLTSGASSRVLPVRDAWWYVPTIPMQAKGMPSQGSDEYVASNPEFGALINYFVGEKTENTKDQRKKSEQQISRQEGNVPFPGYEQLNTERTEQKPQVMLLVRDSKGNPVRWLKGKNAAGLNRTSWDLRHPAPDPIRLAKPAFQPPWAGDPMGPLVAPGDYSVELYIEDNGQLTSKGMAQSFTVKPIPTIASTAFEEISAFQLETRSLMLEAQSMGRRFSEAGERLSFIKAALTQTPSVEAYHFTAWSKLNKQLAVLQEALYGDAARSSLDESRIPGIMGRVGSVAYGHWNTTQLPTFTFRENLRLARTDFEALRQPAEAYFERLDTFEETLKKLGAPYTKGRD